MHKVLIVVPCYNEEERLPAAEFNRFVEEHPDVGFLFVDDGSTDGTAGVLRRLCNAAPRTLRCMTLKHNSGKAEAVRRGVAEVLQDLTVQYVGFWDADLATPLDAISTFVQIQDEHPNLVLVMGARVQLLGRRIIRQPRRHYAGRVFATAASLVLSLPVYDTQCGAKLFRATALIREVFAAPFTARWAFDVEILARMTRFHRLATGLGIADLVSEFPLLQWQDVRGSKRRARDYFVAARDLLLIRHRYMRDLPALPLPSAAAPRQRPVSQARDRVLTT
jgi:dolichyl-phosphate beta-glucosyltransferase